MHDRRETARVVEGSGVWTWRRWQLVRIAREGPDLIVDAIQLSRDPLEEPGALITLAFLPVAGGGEIGELSTRLEDWSRSGDGICDAFFSDEDPPEHIAMFQGTDLLVVAAAPPM